MPHAFAAYMHSNYVKLRKNISRVSRWKSSRREYVLLVPDDRELVVFVVVACDGVLEGEKYRRYADDEHN